MQETDHSKGGADNDKKNGKGAEITLYSEANARCLQQRVFAIAKITGSYLI